MDNEKTCTFAKIFKKQNDMKYHNGSQDIATALNVFAVITIVAGIIYGVHMESWAFFIYGVLSGILFFAMAAIISTLVTISRTVQRQEERILEQERKEVNQKPITEEEIKEIVDKLT